ncbi:DNA-binding protein [Seiridium cupressi]
MQQSRALVWRELAKAVPGRTNKDCRRRWWNTLAGGTYKGHWSESEDERLVQAFTKYGPQWTRVAAAVKTRHPDQCSSHWIQVLDPSINHSDWTPEEDQRLCHAVNAQGTNWAVIAARHVPKRPPLALKNRYYTLSIKRATKDNSAPVYTSTTPSSMPNQAGPEAGRASIYALGQRLTHPHQDAEPREESDEESDDDEIFSPDMDFSSYSSQQMTPFSSLSPWNSTLLPPENPQSDQRQLLEAGTQNSGTTNRNLSFAANGHFNPGLLEDLVEKEIAHPGSRFTLDAETRQAQLINNSIPFSTQDQFHIGENQLNSLFRDNPCVSQWSTAGADVEQPRSTNNFPNAAINPGGTASWTSSTVPIGPYRPTRHLSEVSEFRVPSTTRDMPGASSLESPFQSSKMQELQEVYATKYLQSIVSLRSSPASNSNEQSSQWITNKPSDSVDYEGHANTNPDFPNVRNLGHQCWYHSAKETYGYPIENGEGDDHTRGSGTWEPKAEHEHCPV